MRVNYSIIFVSDMQRSIAFYRDVVGMPLKFESPGWAEFATDGATWALHKGDVSSCDASESAKEKPGTCRTGFQVANLDEFHQRMTENEVKCIQQPSVTFGAKIAQYADPDGLVFSVGEVSQQ